MRRCRATLLAVLSIAAIVSAVRAANQVDVKSMLKDAVFIDNLKNSKSVDARRDRIAYLVLDHTTLKWSVFHSVPPVRESDLPTINKEDEDALPGPDGNPRVMRSDKEKLVLVIVNANPFLYSYEGTVSPPQYSPDAATLAMALSAISSEIKTTMSIKDKEAEYLKSLKNLIANRDQVQSYVRWLEIGGADNIKKPDLADLVNAEKTGLAAVDEIEKLQQDKTPFSCYRVWLPLLRLANLPRTGKKIDIDELKAVRAEMVKINETGDLACDQVVRCAFGELKKLQDSDDQNMVLNEIEKNSQVIKDNIFWDKVLSTKKDFIAAAAQIEAFVQISKSQALGLTAIPIGSKTSSDFIPGGAVAVLSPPFPHQTWLQDNPGTISIKPETSVYPECPRIKPTGVDKKFLLVSHRQAFVGFGLGFTFFKKVFFPSYGAVTLSDSTQEVARTSEDSRFGTIVAMVFFRARPILSCSAEPKNFEPGLEFGVSFNSKKIALFVGPSFEFYRFLRLGVGVSWHQVTSLAPGLKEGDTVYGSPPTIPTKSAGEFRLYAGFSFALDALPLFSPSK